MAIFAAHGAGAVPHLDPGARSAQGGRSGGVDVAPWADRPVVVPIPRASSQRVQSLYDAQIRERSRIARELHDVVGQALTAVRLSLMLARETADPTQLDERLAEGLDLVDSALTDVRAIAYELRPSQLDDLGLIAAVRWHLARHERTSGIRMTLRSSPAVVVDPGVEAAVYRIVQEAVTNILRHAAAHRVLVGLRQRQSELHVDILDDGVGFKVRDGRASPGSMGLTGMSERAHLLGGSLEIRSALGRGTWVCARFPARPHR